MSEWTREEVPMDDQHIFFSWRVVSAALAGFAAWSALWLAGNAIAGALVPGFADAPAGHAGAWGGLLVFALLISACAGYLAALIGKEQGFRSAILLGAVNLVVGIFVQAQYWSAIPLWYHVIFLAHLVPLAWLGAWLRMGRTSPRGDR